MLSRLRTHHSAITFDLGRSGIRAYQLQARGARLALGDCLTVELPSANQSEDKAVTNLDARRLTRLVGQGGFRGRNVNVILSPADVQFHALRLPERVLTEGGQRLQAALEWETSHQTRGESQSLEVRHWRLPPGHHQGPNVMAVAVPTQRAVEWFEQLASEQLHLRRLDVSPCALARLARQIWPPADDELWGVLDLGCHQTNLTVVVGTAPTYVRSLSGSADEWTRQLAGALDVPHAVAERLKRQHGIQPGERGARESPSSRPAVEQLDAGALPSVFFGLLREPLNNLVREINRCFSYVLQNYTDLNISRLVMAGGGAGLHGLAAFLNLQLGLPVVPLTDRARSEDEDRQDPLPRIEFDPTAAAAIGGAILELEAAA
jgi:Tfp pilus assembly PilM family ATPase